METLDRMDKITTSSRDRSAHRFPRLTPFKVSHSSIANITIPSPMNYIFQEIIRITEMTISKRVQFHFKLLEHFKPFCGISYSKVLQDRSNNNWNIEDYCAFQKKMTKHAQYFTINFLCIEPYWPYELSNSTCNRTHTLSMLREHDTCYDCMHLKFAQRRPYSVDHRRGSSIKQLQSR